MRKEGMDIFRNYEGTWVEGWRKEMDETLVNQMKLGWQDGWDSGHLVSR